MTVELRPIDLRPNVNAYELLDQISQIQHFYRNRRRNIQPSASARVSPALAAFICNERACQTISHALINNEPLNVQFAA